ncbi:MAG: hypothetical protein WDM86_23130 [Rhizomicrobium sp.]
MVRPVVKRIPAFQATWASVHLSPRRAPETALRARAEHYRSTLDNLMGGCQLIGFDWRYLHLNRMAAHHSRRPNAERFSLPVAAGLEEEDA